MATLNAPVKTTAFTHEGAPTTPNTPLQELHRTVATCLLWEDTFYEKGSDIAARIKTLCEKISPLTVADLAIETRNKGKLRHVPLWLCRCLASQGKLKAQTLATVIQRPDELTEFMAMYWKDGKVPLSAQVKKGLALAFKKFNAYSLAKYNRATTIKLRDVLFLSHAKPDNKAQDDLWKSLINDTLQTPDTWEVAISATTDKHEEWTRLLKEHKLGALALLRNLRNMIDAEVNRTLIRACILEMNAARVLPFRFISAAKHAPSFEPQLDKKMLEGMNEMPKLTGETIVLVDVSGSMDWDTISSKSDLTRLDAACALAILVRGLCDQARVFTFSNSLVEVPARQGMALRDAITQSQAHNGTQLGKALHELRPHLSPSTRLIVITDEQAHDVVRHPDVGRGYSINVAPYKHGVTENKPWVHINGFSERVVEYIQSVEG